MQPVSAAELAVRANRRRGSVSAVELERRLLAEHLAAAVDGLPVPTSLAVEIGTAI